MPTSPFDTKPRIDRHAARAAGEWLRYLLDTFRPVEIHCAPPRTSFVVEIRVTEWAASPPRDYNTARARVARARMDAGSARAESTS